MTRQPPDVDPQALPAFAAYAERMSASLHVATCRRADRRDRRPLGYGPSESGNLRGPAVWSLCPNPALGCQTLADRTMWARLAAEARAYLHRNPDPVLL